MKLIAIFLTMLAGIEALLAQKKRSIDVEGVIEHYDVRYLPDWRYTGAEGERGDIEMTLDVFVPPGEGPMPTVIYVHGGGYGGGSKHFGGGNKQFAQQLLKEGFVVVSVNYILNPKGIFPQCWWDFRDAVRFLRLNAEEYRIDPLRIGSYGLSAGGWMISSATTGNGDLLRRNNGSAITARELRDSNWKIRVKDPGAEDNWLRPLRSPSPAWSGVHGGVSAISQDFDHYLQHHQSYNGFVQKWAGVDYTPKFWEGVLENGAEANFEFARMTSPGFKGKSVHVPPFYPSGGREDHKAMARAPDGSEKALGEVVLDFFKRRLVEDCRLPEPEIFPVPRVFAESAEVTIVAPPGCEIRYSIDGSEPTYVYTKPIAITDDTVVKAAAFHEGFSPSGANTAHFVKGPAPPKILGPDKLPSGKTGEPYEFAFTADVENARWMPLGELRPHVPWKEENVAFPNNMSLDSETGVWSGTPWKPGKFWLQVWVNTGDGTLATHRDYIWEVTGEQLSGAEWTAKATETDTNVELAHLIVDQGWHGGLIKELRNQFRVRGVKAIFVGEKGENKMLLIESEDLETARQVVEGMIERNEKLAAKTEFEKR